MIMRMLMKTRYSYNCNMLITSSHTNDSEDHMKTMVMPVMLWSLNRPARVTEVWPELGSHVLASFGGIRIRVFSWGHVCVFYRKIWCFSWFFVVFFLKNGKSMKVFRKFCLKRRWPEVRRCHVAKLQSHAKMLKTRKVWVQRTGWCINLDPICRWSTKADASTPVLPKPRFTNLSGLTFLKPKITPF